MRLVIYDNKPGVEWNNLFLRTTWQTWAWKQKQAGECDAVLGANSWLSAVQWVLSFPKVESIQFWGHGSSGTAWCGGDFLRPAVWAPVSELLMSDGYFWLRTCYSFKGPNGRYFAQALSKNLGCTVVGHTKLIGITQPGLQVLKAGQKALWEDESGASIWCFQNTWQNGDVSRETNKAKS